MFFAAIFRKPILSGFFLLTDSLSRTWQRVRLGIQLGAFAFRSGNLGNFVAVSFGLSVLNRGFVNKTVASHYSRSYQKLLSENVMTQNRSHDLTQKTKDHIIVEDEKLF